MKCSQLIRLVCVLETHTLLCPPEPPFEPRPHRRVRRSGILCWLEQLFLGQCGKFHRDVWQQIGELCPHIADHAVRKCAVDLFVVVKVL